MRSKSCFGCLGLTVVALGLGFLALAHCLRDYPSYEEYPSPTRGGSFVALQKEDGLSDWHCVSFIKNLRYRNGAPLKTKYQPLHGFDSLQWSSDGSLLVMDQKYVYDFQNDRETNFPAASPSSPATSFRNRQRIKGWLAKRGGTGKSVNAQDLVQDESVKPRQHTAWLWEQSYWSRLEGQ